MKLAVRVTGRTRLLKECLERMGLKCWAVRGALLVYPRPGVPLPDIVKFNKSSLRILVEEEGGFDASKGRGFATVVCGTSGKKLMPIYVPSERSPSGKHAYFAVEGACVVVSSTYDEGGCRVSVCKYTTRLNGRVPYIKRVKVWLGCPDAAPASVAHYTDAIKAACEKARMPDCTEVLYAEHKEVPNDC